MPHAWLMFPHLKDTAGQVLGRAESRLQISGCHGATIWSVRFEKGNTSSAKRFPDCDLFCIDGSSKTLVSMHLQFQPCPPCAPINLPRRKRSKLPKSTKYLPRGSLRRDPQFIHPPPTMYRPSGNCLPTIWTGLNKEIYIYILYIYIYKLEYQVNIGTI